MSHSDAQGLLWYAVPPMQCIGYDENTWKFLRALNASCDYDTLLPEPVAEPVAEPEPEPVAEPEPEPEPEPVSEPADHEPDEPDHEPHIPHKHHGHLSPGSRINLSIYISALLVVKWWISLII